MLSETAELIHLPPLSASPKTHAEGCLGGRVFSQASGEANVDTGDALLTLRGTEGSSHTNVQLPAVVQG